MNSQSEQRIPRTRRRTRATDTESTSSTIVSLAEVTPPLNTGGLPFAIQDGQLYTTGETPRLLANFTAHITRELILDDGLETHREYEIEVILRDGTSIPTFMIPTSQFASMTWVHEKVGVQAIIAPRSQELVRIAIQYLSEEAEECRIFSHTGWTMHHGQRCYLHAGGAIGADGAVTDVATALPSALHHFELPAPPNGDALQSAVHNVMDLLEIAPAQVIVPLLGAIFRSVFPDADFTVFLEGRTGVFKSQLAALAQQFFGPQMNSSRLPANWSSTANSLESLCFHAKDALIVVDDFVPQGNQLSRNSMQMTAERLIRAQGNASGRHRMKADGTQRLPKPPRGLILATGEEIPNGESLQGRMLIIHVGKDDVNVERLTQAQEDAENGLYASAMSGFISWIASDYDNLISRMKGEVTELRTSLRQQGVHARTPGTAASLIVALRFFLEFCREIEALSEQECERLSSRFSVAILDAVTEHHSTQREINPVNQFLGFVTSLLTTGAAFLKRIPSAGICDSDHRAGDGVQIGWLHGVDIYLDQDAAFAAVQSLVRSQGDLFPIKASTLFKRLDEAGMLVREATQSTRKHRLPAPLHEIRALRLADNVLKIPEVSFAPVPPPRSPSGNAPHGFRTRQRVRNRNGNNTSSCEAPVDQPSAR